MSRSEPPDDVREIHDTNRASWEMAATGSYRRNRDRRLQQLRRRESTLTDVERNALEPLCADAATAVHLQCADGRDTLSLGFLGVRHVIGMDIAQGMLDLARSYAEAVGQSAEWHRSDVLDAADLVSRPADVVYTGKGALMWIHDLTAWARTVRSMLRPGGSLYLYDLHPVTCLFRQDRERLTPTGLSYFGFVHTSQGWPDGYVGDVGVSPDNQPTKYERVWPLAAVIGAVVNAGLRITAFAEHTEAYWDAYPKLPPGKRDTFPKTFSLTACRG